LRSKEARDKKKAKFVASQAQKHQLSLAEAHHFSACGLTRVISLLKLTAAS